MTQRTTFGALLRAAYDRSGLSSREYAKKLGVSQPRVLEIFGQPNTTEDLLHRAAAALGLQVRVELVVDNKPLRALDMAVLLRAASRGVCHAQTGEAAAVKRLRGGGLLEELDGGSVLAPAGKELVERLLRVPA